MTIGVMRILIASACLMAASSTGVEAQERAVADPLPHVETSECPFDVSIATGKVADGDPTVRIAELRRIDTVVRAGRVYSVRDLYAEVGVVPDW
jgi:hypothetical protein